MGKKSRSLDGKKRRKPNKGATRESAPSYEEEPARTKESALARNDYFNPDSGHACSENWDGNVREVRFRKKRDLSYDTSFTSSTSSGRTMSNPSPIGKDTFSPERSTVVDLPIEDGVEKGKLITAEGQQDGDKKSFQVFLRIRPLDDAVQDAGSTRLRSLSVENDTQVLLCTRPSKGKESNGAKHLFTFAHVFAEGAPQRDVFEVTTQSLVDAVLAGHQACVISYGIPNSGKSYTLYGKATSGKHRGVITRAMETLFSAVNSEKNLSARYRVATSFLQIYNEKFYDLLDPSASDGVKLLENGSSATLQGATERIVTTVDETSKQLRKSPNRMRDAGSRSHTVFTVKVTREEVVGKNTDNEDGPEKVIVTDGQLRFVDLVGVERLVKHASYESPAVGSAEAKTAKSLQLFANLVLSSADDGSAVSSFRDSKLTRLLRSAVGGDCMTRLIVTASPCPNLAHETLSCMQFAQKACQIVNQPIARKNVVERCKNLKVEEVQAEEPRPESSRSKSGTPTYKLPPIYYPELGYRTSIGAQDETTRPLEGGIATNQAVRENIEDHVVSSSVVTSPSSLSGEERGYVSTTDAQYIQFVSTETQSKIVTLPLLATASSGKIFTQHTPATTFKLTEKQHGKLSKSPAAGTNRRANRKQKSFDKSGRLSSSVHKTNFSAAIQSAADHVRNGEDALHAGQEHVTNSLGRDVSGESSPQPVRFAQEDKPCCTECKAREEKIKADYDRMILFSKKDRDDKQIKLDELQTEIKKLKTESVSLNHIRALEEQTSQDKTAKEIQAREIARLEVQVETLKAKVSCMVSSGEVTALQELRRKEHQTAEDLRKDIEGLKFRLRDEAERLKKEISTRNDAIKKLERETVQSKKETLDKDRALQEFKKHQEEKSAHALVELNRLQSRHEATVAELNGKLLSSAKDITKMKETEMKLARQRQDEKENLERELGFARQTASQAQAELKIAQGKLVSLEREQRVARSANQGGGFSHLSSKMTRRKSMDFRDMGTAMSNTPDSVRDCTCVTCGSRLDQHDASSSPDASRDEDLRILLMQDARNREILIQLKRERNLLCDVMKIVYCRQWFMEEATPHIKRTLRRVGVDTKSLNTLRKKF